jgi:DNA-3-methyladenine glycosylase I
LRRGKSHTVSSLPTPPGLDRSKGTEVVATRYDKLALFYLQVFYIIFRDYIFYNFATVNLSTMVTRCKWPGNEPFNIKYHDEEWGVPVHDDTKLFEFLVLDAFQAGLSWLTILKKREHFKNAFDNFDYKKIALYSEEKTSELMNNKDIIRNNLKIKAAITNASLFIKIQEEFDSFDKYIWGFVNQKTIKNQYNDFKKIPASTKESDAMSRDLKLRGFKFTGSTICYAFMQAVGMVNDHETTCFRYHQV